MEQLTGVISEIHNPITTKKGTLIQPITIQKFDNSFIYPQVHRRLELLDGFTEGDKVLIEYTLFGNEKKTEQKRVHFTTIVIDKIIKL